MPRNQPEMPINAEIPILDLIFENLLSAATTKDVFIFPPFDNSISAKCWLVLIDEHSALFIKEILEDFFNLL